MFDIKTKKMKLFKITILIVMIAVILSCNNGNNNAEVDKSKNIVVNEILPKNSHFGSDQNGEFDDWIELYNLANEDMDISGYYLSDSKKEPTKFKFPSGTIIGKNGYLIIWADQDTTQTGLHTNFKLSSAGENVVLLSPTQEVINLVAYPATVIEQSYARIPNGTGDFKWSVPTFGKSND